MRVWYFYFPSRWISDTISISTNWFHTNLKQNVWPRCLKCLNLGHIQFTWEKPQCHLSYFRSYGFDFFQPPSFFLQCIKSGTKSQTSPTDLIPVLDSHVIENLPSIWLFLGSFIHSKSTPTIQNLKQCPKPSKSLNGEGKYQQWIFWVSMLLKRGEGKFPFFVSFTLISKYSIFYAARKESEEEFFYKFYLVLCSRWYFRRWVGKVRMKNWKQ